MKDGESGNLQVLLCLHLYLIYDCPRAEKYRKTYFGHRHTYSSPSGEIFGQYLLFKHIFIYDLMISLDFNIDVLMTRRKPQITKCGKSFVLFCTLEKDICIFSSVLSF